MFDQTLKKWYRFDDSDVSSISEETVFGFDAERTVYLLFYVHSQFWPTDSASGKRDLMDVEVTNLDQEMSPAFLNSYTPHNGGSSPIY